MDDYGSLADDYCVNMNLSTEMELPASRETVLHYVEQIQKKYPQMRNFYARERDNFVLEEDKDGGTHRWCSLEPRRICSGCFNPQKIDEALEQHRHALELAPYLLSLSPLDCEALDVLLGFDFNYRGNQNQLISEALGVFPGFERLANIPGGIFIDNSPTLTMALDEECRVQCRLGIETRTNPFQIRSGEFQDEQLSVYVSVRQYGSLDHGCSFVSAIDDMASIARDLVDNYVADAVLEPLARTISLG